MEAQDMRRQQPRGLIAGINAARKLLGKEPIDFGPFGGIYRCAY